MKLLIVLASNPYSHDFNTAIKLARAGIERNHNVSMFFMANGVYSLVREEIKNLAFDHKIILDDLISYIKKIFRCKSFKEDLLSYFPFLNDDLSTIFDYI